MSTALKDPCPCGSGKRYKHCHLPLDQARRRNGLLLALSAVVLIAAGVLFGPRWMARLEAARARSAQEAARAAADSAARAEVQAAPGAAGVVGTPAATGAAAIGVVNPNGVAGPPLRDPNSLTLTPPNSGAVAPGEHPKDWEYDIAHNRYYDPRPGHMHWHSGAPPANPDAPMPVPQVVVTTPDGSPVQVTNSQVQVIPVGSKAPPAPAPAKPPRK